MTRCDLPKRRFELTLRLGADTWDDLQATLEREIGFAILEKKPGNVSIQSGGPSSGWALDVVETPEMTHERYFEEVARWRAQRDG